MSILHFNPIEKYPPVMNLLNFLEKEKVYTIVYTSPEPGKFKFGNTQYVTIKRFGNENVSMIHYLLFYVQAAVALLVRKAHTMVYFESYSYLPVWINQQFGKLFNYSLNISCHYHEYISPAEYHKNMRVAKFQHSLELRNYLNFNFISQTNEERRKRFIADSDIDDDKVIVFKNFPPDDWSRKARVKTPMRKPLRLVSVGALDMRTMYVQELAQWVSASNGITWDIYSRQFTEETIDYLKNSGFLNININDGVDYFNLPDVLDKYDIGLILYKGVSLNHIHSEPNKLFEYLSCGLSVWYSSNITGVDAHQCSSAFPKVMAVDFEHLDESVIIETLYPAPNRTIANGAESECRKYLCRVLYKGQKG